MDQMNQTPETSSSQVTPMTPKTHASKDASLGPIIAIVVIVVLLALGGWYYLTQVDGTLDQQSAAQAKADEAAIENLKTQGTSDELADIETDMNATDLSSLDSASSDVEAGF
ncbi:MAG: hypothetical protein V4449_00935 [Patescibacteria group bacterium]